MFLEIANNNGTKYIRICESVRITDKDSNKSVPKKKTIKNIGPVTKFDDGKPDFISRLKASYSAGRKVSFECVVPWEDPEASGHICTHG